MTETKIDEGMLAKVQALIAKAESTEYGAEAEALYAKAQELMAKYAIDEAMFRDSKNTDTKPIAVTVVIPDPYAKQKFSLLAGVGESE